MGIPTRKHSRQEGGPGSPCSRERHRQKSLDHPGHGGISKGAPVQPGGWKGPQQDSPSLASSSSPTGEPTLSSSHTGRSQPGTTPTRDPPRGSGVLAEATCVSPGFPSRTASHAHTRHTPAGGSELLALRTTLALFPAPFCFPITVLFSLCVVYVIFSC